MRCGRRDGTGVPGGIGGLACRDALTGVERGRPDLVIVAWVWRSAPWCGGDDHAWSGVWGVSVRYSTIRSRHVNKASEERLHESALLRRTFRDDGRGKHDTLANLPALPGHIVDVIETSLKGETFVPARNHELPSQRVVLPSPAA